MKKGKWKYYYIVKHKDVKTTKSFPLCQTYKHTIVYNQISIKWTNIQEAGC